MRDRQSATHTIELLVFELAGVRFGIGLDAAREVLRAVLITPLPGAPSVVEGIIDIRGTVVPVYDLRSRFGLPARRLHPDDRLVTAWTGDRLVALRCDRTEWITSAPASAVDSSDAVTGGERRIVGTARLADGMVLITDLATFLDGAERDALARALAATRPDDGVA